LQYEQLIPVYGAYLAYQDLSDESIPFSERVELAVIHGITGAGQFIVAAELGFISMGQVKIAKATVELGPAVSVTAILAGLTYVSTKKGADVEHGPYGSVKITPRLGVF